MEQINSDILSNFDIEQGSINNIHQESLQLDNDEMDELKNFIDSSIDEHNKKYRGERIDTIRPKEEEISKSSVTVSNDIIVGIDLGTSNSCISMWRNNKLEIIPDEKGHFTIPSVIAFANSMRFIGTDAKNQSELNPENTYYDIKRLIGRLFSDPNVQDDLKFLTYNVCASQNDAILINCSKGNRQQYTPQELSAMILMKLKIMACEYTQQDIKKAVITVPAYFNDSQREATKEAATIAGLECVRIINEPTAAALAYGFTKRDVKYSTILVYDLGGGTLDVSIMKLNVKDSVFQVLASSGNTHLGGSDFDNYVMNYCKIQFKKKFGISELDAISLSSIQLLKKRCEKAKIQLSTRKTTTIAVKNFYDTKDLCIILTRDIFEKVCSAMFIACMKPIEDAVKSCGLNKFDIDDIILVGGSTKIPRIKQNIEYYFGKTPNDTVNPDITVSAGAAIQGHILSNTEDPFSNKVTILDVLPLSLGVETMKCIMTTIIPRNSVIPIKKTKRFYSDEDNQNILTIKIYEGERKLTKDNYLIGSFDLNITPNLKELQQIMVGISVDFNGIIDVTAEEGNKEDNKQTIRVSSNKNKLSEKEINEMIKEATEMALHDKIMNEIKQSRFVIHDLCKTILDNINKSSQEANTMSQRDKDDIISDVNQILLWLDNDDIKREDYHNVLKKIKTNYGCLITRKRQSDEKELGSADNKLNGVSLFNEDEPDSTIFEKIEMDDIIPENISDNEKKQLLCAREQLTDMCYELYNMINRDDTILLKDSDKQAITYLIDDTLLWVYITEHAKIIDYNDKLNKLNADINSITTHYENLFKQSETKIDTKDLLENMCNAIKCSIDDKLIFISDIDQHNILSFINNTLQWCDQNEGNDEECTSKMNILNELCEKAKSSIRNLNVQNTIETIHNEHTILELSR